jgi:hypothetical protein
MWLDHHNGQRSVAAKYLFDLMARVAPDQRWGITAAAPSHGSTDYVKNGWVDVDSDDDRWLVNSIGRIVEPGHDWLIALLSDHHLSRQQGIDIVEDVAVEGHQLHCKSKATDYAHG